MACTSFMHMLASTWQKQASDRLQMTFFDPRTLPKEDTTLFLRDEMVAFIREHGGVTVESGARRDGRLMIVDQS